MSKLLEAQLDFGEDVGLLIEKALELGFRIKLGEVYRPPELQEVWIRMGKSWTKNSRHLEQRAIDIQLFRDGVWITDEAEYAPLGVFWESLRPGKNKWGVGNAFPKRKDAGHFERLVL